MLAIGVLVKVFLFDLLAVIGAQYACDGGRTVKEEEEEGDHDDDHLVVLYVMVTGE